MKNNRQRLTDRHAIEVLVFIAVVLTWTFTGVAGTVPGTEQVIDGNTLDIAGIRIRIDGIDAAEPGQNAG